MKPPVQTLPSLCSARPKAQFSRIAAALILSLFALSALPSMAAVGSVDVDIVRVAPLVDDDLVYLKMWGNTQASPTVGRLAIDLYLQNNETVPVRIDHVRIDFDSPAIAPLILEDGLQLRCPFPGPSGPPMTKATGLDLAPGQVCRLMLTDDPVLALPAPAKARVGVIFEDVFIGLNDLERDLISHTHPTPSGSFRYPAKAEDLAPGEYWSNYSPNATFHHRNHQSNDNMVHAYDVGVVRYDAGAGAWVATHPLGPSGLIDENSDYLSWGKPVYAMADGEVAACSSGNPDDLPGMDMGSTANAFTITHGDELVWYGHLKEGSVDQAICFDGALVEEGQYLGQVGNSGVSSQPHLHIQSVRNGDPMPLQFNDAFVISRNDHINPALATTPWNALTGQGPSWTPSALWPSPLRRRGSEDGALTVAETTLATTSNSRTVTASRRTNGQLLTYLWQTDTSGTVTALDFDAGGTLGALALTVPKSSNDAALALVNNSGKLKLIGYDIAGNSLSRGAQHTAADSITDVAASPSTFVDGVMTAVRTQAGNLRVIAWRVDPEAGVIQRRGQFDGVGNVRNLAMARGKNFPGVVTAARGWLNRLELQTVKVEWVGWVLNPVDDHHDDAILDVDIAWVSTRPNGTDLVVTASRTVGGNLELVSWEVSAKGRINRLGEVQAGAISEVSLAKASGEHVLTSVRDGSGNLKVIAWHVGDDGTFTRRGEAQAGEASAIAQAGVTQLAFNDPKMTVTAVADSSDVLKLIAWQVQLTD